MTDADLVLVVDDEKPIREVVRRYLEADGFAVVEAATGAEALEVFRARRPAVVVLDVMLPGVDGLEVLRQLRAVSEAYVILLTARTEEVDRLVGLSVGADDYVTKPFSPRELVARVKAVLRRPHLSAGRRGDLLSFSDLTIDQARHEITAAGEHVALTVLEFDLLVALAGEPGRVLSRRQLLERVWGYDFFGDERVVDVHIANLRRKLADDAEHPRWIASVRGVGYKFIGG